MSKYFLGIFLFSQYNLAGWSDVRFLILFKPSSIVGSLNFTGSKSNSGFGVAGADFLYLSKRYCSYILGSINFIKLGKLCPCPQL